MSRVARRRQAAADIAEIWQHIAQDKSAAADRWIDDLDQQFGLLARQPLMGRERQELADGVRSFPFGRYVIFYVALADGIDVLRVLHSSMDIEARFDPDR
ncbi:type II toxin-antitoxin system RelE/ParE family toxin [Immundisolibacter sp.]|uniref:type II toxin-antitoxin system RelE/ParE family toxin n=1 Tax=Immundisolibacter sp. TaxID=1934948 RepID=UPI0035623A0A